MKAAFSVSNQGYPLRDAFILDSGSTTHICNNFSRLRNVRPSAPGDYLWAENTKFKIQGYGNVLVNTTGSQGKQTLRLDTMAWCPNFLCSLISFRLLRRQGIWWEYREIPTSLRLWDGTIVAILLEEYGQWTVEQPATSAAAFHLRMNRSKRRS